MKPYQICGLGNALVDIFLEVSAIQKLGFRGMRLVMAPAKAPRAISSTNQARRGSVANPYRVLSAGGQAALSAALAMIVTLFYATNSRVGIDTATRLLMNTGTAFIITDAERTMRTCLAFPVTLQRGTWTLIKKEVGLAFIEAMSSPTLKQPDGVREAIKIANERRSRSRVQMPRCKRFGTPRDALNKPTCSSQQTEACAVTGAASAEEAFDKLTAHIPCVVPTDLTGAMLSRSVKAHVTFPPAQGSDSRTCLYPSYGIPTGPERLPARRRLHPGGYAGRTRLHHTCVLGRVPVAVALASGEL
jgi:hypothetical protein